MMRHTRLTLALLAALAAAAASGQTNGMAAPVSHVRIVTDPPVDGKQCVTIDLTPTASFTAETIEAECRYRQEFDWPPNAAKPGRRAIEPEVFTFRWRQVKFVDDLDLHLSFFVPVDLKELRDKHGATTFVTNAPVTLSTITVKAFAGDKILWSFKGKPVATDGEGVLR
jgi:hypothetical protein